MAVFSNLLSRWESPLVYAENGKAGDGESDRALTRIRSYLTDFGDLTFSGP